MIRARWIFTIVATLLSVACSDEATNPGATAGNLVVSLTTPRADDGALLFEVNGPRIDSVTAIDGSLHLFTRRVSDSTIVGAVVGTLANGAIITLRVPDMGAAARYTATVREVADRQDALRGSLAGYTLTVIQ